MKFHFFLPLITLFIVFFFTSCSKSEDTMGVTPQSSTLPETEKHIFALGDSLTAGYGLPLEDAYPAQLETLLGEQGYNVIVTNAGVSGNTSAELLARLDWTLTDTKPGDIAILSIGGNDGLRRMSLTDLKNNIESILDILREKELKIILTGQQIPPNLGLKYTNDFKKIYFDIAKSQKDLYFFEFLLDGVAAKPEYNQSDMIHPNTQGYAIVVKNIAEFLISQKLLGSQ